LRGACSTSVRKLHSWLRSLSDSMFSRLVGVTPEPDGLERQAASTATTQGTTSASWRAQRGDPREHHVGHGMRPV